MTKVIAILNQKGGSGKTTIATNITHCLCSFDYKCLMIDADPQGNARDWQEINSGQFFPMVGLDRETLPKELAAISNGYDFVVIDGAPQIAKMTAAAIKAAHLVIMPVQPSPYDIWATADTVDLIKARQEVTDGLPAAAFLISRAIKNTRLSKEILEALKDYELPILKNCTHQRVIYASSAAIGETVMTSKDTDAKKEIKLITSEILEMLPN